VNDSIATKRGVTPFIIIIIVSAIALIGIVMGVFYLNSKALRTIENQKSSFDSIDVTPDSVFDATSPIPIQALPFDGNWKINTEYLVAWNNPNVITDKYVLAIRNDTTREELILVEDTVDTSAIILITQDQFSKLLQYKNEGSSNFHIVIYGYKNESLVAQSVSSAITIKGNVQTSDGNVIESNTDVVVRAAIFDTQITQIKKAGAASSDIFKITYRFKVSADGVGDKIFIDKNIFLGDNASKVQKGFEYYLGSVPVSDALTVSTSVKTNAKVGEYGYVVEVGQSEEFTITFTVEALAAKVDMQVRLNTIGWSGIDSPARYIEYFDDNAVQSVSLISNKVTVVVEPEYERIGLRPNLLTSNATEKIYVYDVSAPADRRVSLTSQSFFIESGSIAMKDLRLDIKPRSNPHTGSYGDETIATVSSGTYTSNGAIVTVPFRKTITIPAGETARLTLYATIGEVGDGSFISVKHPKLAKSYISS